MPLMSFAVDLAMAGLMIALIVYCAKLNRRLGAIRDNDAEIRKLVDELRSAADRADASVNVLKAAGVEAERSLRVQVLRAEALRGELGAAAARAAPRAAAGAKPAPSADPYPDDGFFARPAAPAPMTRRDAETELLRAIRSARAEG